MLHTTTAEVKAVYEDDFYKGMPAVTVNSYGKGKAYYIATAVERAYLDKLYCEILKESEVSPVMDTQGEIEVTARNRDGERIVFVINHGKEDGAIDTRGDKYQSLLTDEIIEGTRKIPAGDVMVLKKL